MIFRQYDLESVATLRKLKLEFQTIVPLSPDMGPLITVNPAKLTCVCFHGALVGRSMVAFHGDYSHCCVTWSHRQRSKEAFKVKKDATARIQTLSACGNGAFFLKQ